MPSLEDNTNMTKVGHVYTGETAVSTLAADTDIYDIVENATVILKSSGALRFNGARITFKNCVIIEEESANDTGSDNFNTNSSRYLTGSDVKYINCVYVVAESTETGNSSRRDFDIRSGANVLFEDTVIIIEGATATFNHFDSTGITIKNLRIINGTGGAAFETKKNFATEADGLILNDLRSNTDPVGIFAANFENETGLSLSFKKLDIVKSDGTYNDNKQVIKTYGGNNSNLLTLVDSVRTLSKATADNNSANANYVVARSYKGKNTLFDGTDLSVKINIQRLGYLDSGNLVSSYSGSLTAGDAATDVVTLTIVGQSDSRTILTVGDPIVFTGSSLPGGIVAGTIYYLRVVTGNNSNKFQLATTSANALSGSSIVNITGSGSGTFISNLNESVDVSTGASWAVDLVENRSPSHVTTTFLRNRYTRSCTKYGYKPNYKTFNVEWNTNYLDGIDDGVQLFEVDSVITESTIATVAAYTGIALNTSTMTVTISENTTLEKLADWLQLYATSNPGNSYVESRNFCFCTKEGVKVNFGNLNIVINTLVTLSKTTKYDGIITTGTITETGTLDAFLTDSNGTSIKIVTSTPYTKIYTELVTAGTIAILNTSTGKEVYMQVPVDDTVKLTAKAEGYKHVKATVDPAVTGEVLFSLEKETFVDTSVDVSGYVINGAANATNVNNIFMEYNATKSILRVGVINIKDKINVTRRLFDEVMTSDGGMKFLHKFDNTLTALNGLPYIIKTQKIIINETYLDLKLMTSVLSSETGTFGCSVHKVNDDAYLAPTETNGKVEIDSLRNLQYIESSTVQDILTRDDFTTPMAEAVRTEIDSNSTKLDVATSTLSVSGEVMDVLLDKNILGTYNKEFEIDKAFTIILEADANEYRELFLTQFAPKLKIGIKHNGTNYNTRDHDLRNRTGVTTFESSFNAGEVTKYNSGSVIIQVSLFNSLAPAGGFSAPDGGSFDFLVGKIKINQGGVIYPVVLNTTALSNFTYVSVDATSGLRIIRSSNETHSSVHSIVTIGMANPVTEIYRFKQTSVDEIETNVGKINGTDVDGPDAFKANVSTLGTQAIQELLYDTIIAGNTTGTNIKAMTDKLNFNDDDDVKVTLDSEEVVTDSASRTASKADVSSLASQSSVNVIDGIVDTINTNVVTIDTVVDSVKAKTDSLSFTGTDVKATLDSEEVDVGKLKGTSVISSAGFYKAFWKILTADITEASSFGKLIKDNLNEDVSSVLDQATIARKILENRYEITNTEFIIYEDNGTTVYKRYTLQSNSQAADASGGRVAN